MPDQLPDQGVLAATAADDEDLHCREIYTQPPRRPVDTGAMQPNSAVSAAPAPDPAAVWWGTFSQTRPVVPPLQRDLPPPRAGDALVFSFMSLLFGILSLFAIQFVDRELERIKLGICADKDRGRLDLARTVAVIAAILWLLGIVVCIVRFAMASR